MRLKRLGFDDLEAQIRAALPDGWKIVKHPSACVCGGHRYAKEWRLRYKLDAFAIPGDYEISIRRVIGGWAAEDKSRTWALKRFNRRFRNIGDAVRVSTRYVACENGFGGKS